MVCHRFCGLWVEGCEDGMGEFGLVMGEQAAMSGDEAAGERLEVFHVWAENHGFAGDDCLAGVLAAGGEEAFADDYGVGVGCPITQFAGGIDEENVVIFLDGVGGGGEF